MIEFRDVTFYYGDDRRPALAGATLRIESGEFILVGGDSGSGKSTLLRCLNGLVPHFYGGRFGGRVVVDGIDTRGASVAEMGPRVGLVFQDSAAQIVTDTVADEAAFGPANLGLPSAEVKERAKAALADMGLTGLMSRRTSTLSGGEKQKVAIAAVLSMRPAVLALDEPLAELDPEGAAALVDLLRGLNRRLGLTVIVAEHRTDLLAPVADRVVEMDGGILTAASGAGVSQANERHGREGAAEEAHPAATPGETVLEVNDLNVAYGKRSVLNGLDLVVRAGEIVALRGPNGAGKTSLLRAICGFLAPAGGRVAVAGMSANVSSKELFRQVGYVPQRPGALLFADTAADEVRGRPGALDDFGLAEHAGDYPRDLSLGEQQRLALAVVLSKEPRLILLDEPTHGLDHGAKKRLAALLRAHAGRGAGILLATHDEDMARLAADRTVWLNGGRVQGVQGAQRVQGVKGA